MLNTQAEHDDAKNYITDSLVILAPNRIYNLRQSEQIEKLFYFRCNDSLMEYHLDSGKYRSICSVYDYDRIIDFYPVNYDSIFLLCRYSNSIVLIDNNVIVKKRYKIPIESNYNTLFSSTQSPFHISKKRIAFFAKSTVDLLNTNHKLHYEKTQNKEVFYDLNKEKFLSINEYINLPINSVDVRVSNLTRTLKNDTAIIYAYSKSDSVYILNINTKELTKKIIVSKHYTLNDKFDTLKYGNLEYFNNYFLLSNNYWQILYDDYRNLFYRTFIHKADSSDNVLEKDWNLIICDNNFEILNEVSLKGKHFYGYALYVTSQGVLIEEYNTTFNPKNNVHKFKVFRF